MALYRYLTFEVGVATLKKGSLKLTPPSEFNDPFDMKPAWDVALTEEELRQAYIETGCSQMMSFFDFQKSARPSSRETQDAAMRSFTKHMNEKYGAVCFSRIHDSIPMWAYYAGNHSGLVIEFNEQDESFDQLFRGTMTDVHYEQDRPVFKKLGGENLDCLYVKADAWSHEKEFRILHPLDGEGVSELTLHGKRAYFVSFPKCAVKSVILGCRISQPHQSLLCHYLAAWGYSHAQINKFVPDPMKYGMASQRCGCVSP